MGVVDWGGGDEAEKIGSSEEGGGGLNEGAEGVAFYNVFPLATADTNAALI